MQYFDYLQDTYNIHETFVKVPQSHYIHNKVVKFDLSQDRQKKKKIPNYFQNLKLVLGIGRENHYRLSEHISRLIIDCTIEMYVPLTLTSEVIKNAQYLTM